jgi:hypothetical protein
VLEVLGVGEFLERRAFVKRILGDDLLIGGDVWVEWERSLHSFKIKIICRPGNSGQVI